MIKEILDRYNYQKKWRKLNPHNTTIAKSKFNTDLVKVGNYTYGKLDIMTFNDIDRLSIGHFCSIGPNVLFIVSGNHHTNKYTTFPCRVKIVGDNKEGVTRGNIVVEDDVWIGANVTILSGVTIGQGAIIGAGSVVTKDIPPYTIACGNPCKVIKNRFNNEITEKMKLIDFSKINKDIVSNNIDLLYSEPTLEDIDYLLNLLK